MRDTSTFGKACSLHDGLALISNNSLGWVEGQTRFLIDGYSKGTFRLLPTVCICGPFILYFVEVINLFILIISYGTKLLVQSYKPEVFKVHWRLLKLFEGLALKEPTFTKWWILQVSAHYVDVMHIEVSLMINPSTCHFRLNVLQAILKNYKLRALVISVAASCY